MVAIPTLAAGDALTECLQSLALQTYRDFKIVVVDNSGRSLVKPNEAAHVIKAHHNLGFGAAVNLAWDQFDSPLAATLNDDAIAAPNWLAALVEASERYPEAGMFASRVELGGRGALDSAGMLLCADGSSKQRGHGEPSSNFDDAEEVLLPSGAAALYRRSMLRETGVFDPAFFLYCEDTDLGLRARRAGWGCRYVPDARVTHRYSHSAGRVSALKAYHVERNRIFVAVKNFPLSMLFKTPFVSVIRYAWHAIFLLRGQGAASQFAAESGAGWRLPWLVLKAHLALIRHAGRLRRQRKAIASTAKLPPFAFRALLRRFSIPVRKIAEY